MGKNAWDDDERDDDWVEDDLDEDDDFDGGEEEPTVDCPYCRREIHEDAQRCPHCERYISKEDMPWQRRPWWMIILAVMVLYLVFRWTVR